MLRTTSVVKEVCHRKPSTDCKAFVVKKLFSKCLETPAICCGRKHEDDTILSYMRYKGNHGISIDVRVCGMVIDASTPWLAASPDRIIIGQDERQKRSKAA